MQPRCSLLFSDALRESLGRAYAGEGARATLMVLRYISSTNAHFLRPLCRMR